MIAGDAIGRLAIAQEPTTGTTFVLNAATGTFTLTGEAATFVVSMQAGQGAFALTGNPVTFAVQMPAAFGAFLLNGLLANIEITPFSGPMVARRDYWDVDEWGRFIPGSGVRFTL